MRTSVYTITAVLLLLAAVGCDTTTGPGQDGKAVVSLAIAGTVGRSVLPAHAELQDVSAWRLLGGKTGGTQSPLTALFSDPDNQTLYLETGAWDFTLEGYADASGETLILAGTITDRTISLDGPNTLSFAVEPLMNGKGSVRILINLPAGHGINRVEVFKDGVKLNDPPITLNAQNNIVFEQIDHEAGDYYYSFRLYRETELYGVVSELVQVRQNLCSEETYTLGMEDLNLSYLITYDQKYDDPQEDLPPDYYRHTAAFNLPIPARLGYTFEGWHDNAKLEGKPVAKIPALSVGDKDFYADWSLDTYDIHYELYDGGNDPGNPATYTIIKLPITLLDPTHADREFRGWYTDDEFTKGPISEIPANSTGHKTFHAKWDPGVVVNMILQSNNDPALSHTSISEDGEAQFTTAGAGYESWQWRWDGKIIEDAQSDSDTYTLTEDLKIPGVYELSVKVITEGKQTLSARCRVTIKAKEGGAE